MIIWITGQPATGKSTLANELKNKLAPKSCLIIDGDQFRNETNNQDYSKAGRRLNVERIMMRALEENNNYNYVIVAAVSPFIDQRNWIKEKTGAKEICLTSTRVKEGCMVEYYLAPLEKYLHIDTDNKSVDETTAIALKYVLS
jgi:adenylylsulfate kinase-like enzyme